MQQQSLIAAPTEFDCCATPSLQSNPEPPQLETSDGSL